MKNSLLILLLFINLTGCAGYTYNRDLELAVGREISPVEAEFRTKPEKVPNKKNPDGSEMYVVEDGHTWCGLTIWAIIPIPFWLPGCRAHTEVTYKDGVAVREESQGPVLSGRLCGPFMPWVESEYVEPSRICPAIK